MTERLADVSARINGIRQLGAVVNAMRGIAAARAQQARGQLAAVDSYAATIADAIGRTLALLPPPRAGAAGASAGQALVVFGAEQGFAGTFSERVFDAIGPELARSELFLVGTRGNAVAAERGISVGWHSAMPAHGLGIPKLADRITEALFARIAAGRIDRLTAVFSQWLPGPGIHIARRGLFPLDFTGFRRPVDANPPVLNLAPDALVTQLTADYVHAQICNAALHAFAAENEARMETMASARGAIERHLSALRSTERIVRQEEITAEIIELAAGETANRSSRTR